MTRIPGTRYPNVLFSDYHITWTPILGSYSYSWLRLGNRRRRDWGSDWWENEEWFSLECSFRESLDLYHEHAQELSFILDDDELLYYSMSQPIAYPSPVLLPKYCGHAISVFTQRKFFIFLDKWETKYLTLYEPTLLNYLYVAQELKYSDLDKPLVDIVFKRRVIYYLNIEVFTPILGYTIEREEVDKDLEDQYGRKWLTKYLRVYSWYIWDFFVRLKYDYRNIAFVSFIMDLRFRGFSFFDLRKRFIEAYDLIRNLAYLETYITLVFVLAWYICKRKVFIFYFFPRWFSVLVLLGGALYMAILIRDVRELTDTPDDSDPDLMLNRYLYTPLDPEIDEILNPSDLEISVGAVEENSGVLGQDEEDWDFCDNYIDEWVPLLFESEFLGQVDKSNIGSTILSGLDYPRMERYVPKWPQPPTVFQYFWGKVRVIFGRLNSFLYKHVSFYRHIVNIKRQFFSKIRAFKAKISGYLNTIKSRIKAFYARKKKQLLDYLDKFPFWWYFYRRFKIWRINASRPRSFFVWWQRWQRHNWWDWGFSLEKFDWVARKVPGYYKYFDAGHGFSDILLELHDYLNQRHLDKMAAEVLETEEYLENKKREDAAEMELWIRRIMFPKFYPLPFYIEHD